MPRPTYKSTDTLVSAGTTPPNCSLLHFWEWAFSDLCDDDLKGIFAEWLVMQLIGLPSVRRMNWANSDIITSEGVRIEVKASSYWQSWKLLDEFGNPRTPALHPISPKTRIRFSGLTARDAVAVPNRSVAPKLKSDIYVFALQRETSPELWNAMDLSQWEFYVLLGTRLRELRWRSISLEMLRSEQSVLSPADLGPFVKQAIDTIILAQQSSMRD